MALFWMYFPDQIDFVFEYQHPPSLLPDQITTDLFPHLSLNKPHSFSSGQHYRRLRLACLGKHFQGFINKYKRG
jgi:hypothetical protein